VLPFLIASTRSLSLAASALPVSSKAEEAGIAVLDTPIVDGLDLVSVEIKRERNGLDGRSVEKD
jgi:hypothetical protein